MSVGSSDQVSIREVTEDDLRPFFEHQSDSVAVEMAVFPARDLKAHTAHWHKVLENPTITTRTVLFDGEVAGNVVCWEEKGQRNVGYWLGRGFWGKGIATTALSQFLEIVAHRPLYASAPHNIGSRRVLEKCGFIVDHETDTSDDDVAEVVMVLRS